jgi:KaiC/GvpD/RAD55 family RecA-like ATPase
MTGERKRLFHRSLSLSITLVQKMPTFQSIGIHPELRTRLVTESSLQEEDGHVQRPQPVETPQALLSRNPTQLRLLDRETGASQPISALQVRKLRDDVAHALITQSRSGKRVKRLRQAVHEHFHDEDAGEGIENVGDESSASTPSLAIEGFSSALDLVRYETLQHSKANMPQLSTGCQSLDAMLALPPEYTAVSAQMTIDSSVPTAAAGAGIPFGYVTQLSGPPASGKTQVALQIAARQAPTASTWYLCSTASAAAYAKRLDQLVRRNPRSSQGVLDRTIFRTVTDEYMVLSALADLEAVLLNEEDSTGEDPTDEALTQCPQKPSLLIIDSISGCMSMENEDIMTKVALTLKRLARQNGLAVVVTNGTVTDRSDSSARSTKPALGRAWKSAVDIHVWLEPLVSPVGENKVVVSARLDQHPAKRCFAKDDDPVLCAFCITSCGLKEMTLV